MSEIHHEKYRDEFSMSVVAACDITETFAAVSFHDRQLDRCIARSVIPQGQFTAENAAAELAKLIFMAMRAHNIPVQAVTSIGCAACFSLESALEEELAPSDMFLRPDPPIIVIPFVGMNADSRFAAMLATVPSEKGTLAISLGKTLNLAYHNGEKLLLANVELTGAFDGSAIESGMACELGAIDELQREEDKTLCSCVVGDGDACGIAPSAVLDGVAIMVSEGIIDEDGIMTDRDMFYLGEDHYITQSDVRAVQSDKAKTCAALSCFLKKCDGVEKVYIGGNAVAREGLRRLVELRVIPESLAKNSVADRSFTELGTYKAAADSETLAALEQLIYYAEDITNDIYDGFDDLYIENLAFQAILYENIVKNHLIFFFNSGIIEKHLVSVAMSFCEKRHGNVN